jgi:putative inorganic carbon (HCO3(-)) transporter
MITTQKDDGETDMRAGTAPRVMAYLVFLVTIPLGEIALVPGLAWLSITKLSFLLLLGVLAGSLLRGWRPTLPPWPLALTIGATALAVCICAALSNTPLESAQYAARILSLCLLLLITQSLAAEPGFIAKATLALLSAAGVCALLGIYQTATGRTIAGLGHYGYFGRLIEISNAVEGGVSNSVIRAGATFDHPNVFGTFLIGMLPSALVMMTCAGRRLFRRLAGPLSAILLVALVYTFSRSAWLGGLVGVGGVIFACRVNRLKAFALIALALSLGVVMVPSGAKEVLLNRTGAAQSYDVGRLYSWRTAVKMVAAHPLTGVGPGMFHASYPLFAEAGEVYQQNPLHHMDAHNTFLDLGAEGGLLTCAAFSALLIVVCSLMLRSPLTRPSETLPLLAGCVAIFLQSMLQSLQYEEIWWVLMGLGICSTYRLPSASPETSRTVS